ncbi:MAG: hypothetical protein VKJ24_03670 [Synechococcales bacterium]|nr:hypothetical protein [Synechococcales bacterium]
MVAQINTEKPQLQEPIAVGQVILTLPVGVDAKPYIRQILWIELESIAHPKAKERLEFGLRDAQTDEDFSSLIESFHLCRNYVNAEILFDALENDVETSVYGSVDELQQELDLEEEAS